MHAGPPCRLSVRPLGRLLRQFWEHYSVSGQRATIASTAGRQTHSFAEPSRPLRSSPRSRRGLCPPLPPAPPPRPAACPRPSGASAARRARAPCPPGPRPDPADSEHVGVVPAIAAEAPLSGASRQPKECSAPLVRPTSLSPRPPARTPWAGTARTLLSQLFFFFRAELGGTITHQRRLNPGPGG